MKDIDFTMTYFALKTFGKQLYANISAAIAELVANGLDANANNVYVYMDIKNRKNATIAIFDDGDGMDETSLESQYAVVGRNKRDGLSQDEAATKMGRKGIGKLAALYLSNNYYIITKKIEMDKPRVWMLNITKDQKDDKSPKLTEVDYAELEGEIFTKDLCKAGKGTIIFLKNVNVERFGSAAEDALEFKLANYFLTANLQKNIKLCVIREDDDIIKLHNVEKSIAYKNMAAIYTTNKEVFNDLVDNIVKLKDDDLKTQSQLFEFEREVSLIPDTIDTTIKDEQGKSEKISSPITGIITIDDKDYEYALKGWIGIHSTIDQTDAQINDERFRKNIHYNPNQLRIYVRNKLATSNFLSYLGMTATFLNYIEGEISFDILDVEDLEDIATAGRDNFTIQDVRVKLLIALCKGIIGKLISKRQSIANQMKDYRNKIDENIKEQERIEIKNCFKKGTIKSKHIFEKMPKEDQQAVEDDFVQFSRAANLSRPTTRILISHKKDCEEFGNFLIEVMLKIEPTLRNRIIFTSNDDFGVPQGYDICTYLNECFRDDIYVIFLFSRSYYDSNICLAEAGAAWGTNKQYTNLVIDMNFQDIADPINRNQKGARLTNLSEDDKKSLAKEIIRVINTVGIEKEFDVDQVINIIDSVITDFGSRLTVPNYMPYRKFQAIPICNTCRHAMELIEEDGLKYGCECGSPSINAKIK